ncbi:glycosyl hydrolase family 28-related protein [Sphingomonas yabuuchiae]|uniref:Right-handed parallel beta-helix repeat-containing protein n=1 Tax=Sphingomonas yabuuchiae TaxID=172044 RepID=A0AA40ZWR6_9SPHN|nr:glycosyl hydrolase family 28-related protein [Sphingomonas yabuuchiae]MBB4611401.1 hypothetical protein [Sphingomonas yabuuchiae]MBN3556987.1 right-handed parallel beta-helix repeat-containing protein [Sphingomonas yabuuchiae]
MTDGITRRTTLAALAGGVAPLRQDVGKDLGDSAMIGQSVAAPFIRSRSVLEKLREIGSSVRDTGAVGDGRADDTHAVQDIADYYARVGGEWFFPAGIFRTTAPIVLNCTKPQRIRGRGKRGVYPGRYDPAQPSELAILMPTHAARGAVRFVGSRTGDGSVELHDLALATLETGSVPIAAFAWDASDRFLRNFTFSGCSIHGFTSAFDLFRSGGGNSEMGLFKAQNCTINRNRWIARTLDQTQWNGFLFQGNEAGQNGYAAGDGGIAITAHNVSISNNCLEGQRDPVKLMGSMRGISVADNYFEDNVGNAAVHLENIRGPFDIGANSFQTFDQAKLNHLVLLSNCGHGRVLGPYRADGVHKMALPVTAIRNAGRNGQSANVNSDTNGLLRMDGFDNGNGYLREPQCSALARERVVAAGRAIAPWNGQPMPVAHHDTKNDAAIAFDVAIRGGAGDWAVVSWLFSRETAAAMPSDPYASISINGTGMPSSRDYIAYGFDEYWRAGEWCLLTAAVRLKVEMKRLLIRLYPYGVTAPGGHQTHYLNPVVYVTDSAEAILPYIDDYIARSVLKPPAVDGFLAGDVLVNAAVVAGGQSHYVKLPGAIDRWAYA